MTDDDDDDTTVVWDALEITDGVHPPYTIMIEPSRTEDVRALLRTGYAIRERWQSLYQACLGVRAELISAVGQDIPDDLAEAVCRAEHPLHWALLTLEDMAEQLQAIAMSFK